MSVPAPVAPIRSFSRSVSLSGLKLRWMETGPTRGRPVVLVHGLPTSPGLWRRVTPLLATSDTPPHCLAFELTGYGASIRAGLRQDLSVSAQADTLLAWLRALDLRGAVLVGHDIGGGVVQIAAARDAAREDSGPRRIAGLVFVDSVFDDSWPVLQAVVMARGGPVTGLLPGVVVREAARLLASRGHRTSAMSKESFAEHWRHYEAAPIQPARALVRQTRALRSADTRAVADEVGSLDLPAAVIWGDDDVYQPVSVGRSLAERLDVPLQRVLEGRHFLPEDAPRAVADAVIEVLGQL
jgi:pimeloyl-ACP methyl ester carboxylesterase